MNAPTDPGCHGLLAIDIGNTNIHFGLRQDDRWALSWRARTVPDKMPDEYAVLVRNFLASAGLTYGDVTGVVIGSVVPALTLAFAEVAERYLQRRPLIVNAHTPIGIRIDIDQPEQAGPDRYINAAAVAALHGGPAIVVDFGTATTFDVVGADGSYRGGAIAPGILVAHDALVSRAARLHQIDLQPPPSAIGRNTIHAMQSGIFLGYIALIEGMVARIKAAMPEPDETITVIATGGLAPLFKQHTPVIDQIEPELTLEGLRIIYALNQPR
ncbi:MAG: type III pantothenate kinase [Candidatus Flexifilum sp.]|jgi:type III pantothenate kinase